VAVYGRALVTASPCYGALEIVVFDWLIDWMQKLRRNAANYRCKALKNVTNIVYMWFWFIWFWFWWFATQRYYVHKTCFRENRKDTILQSVKSTNVVCPWDMQPLCVWHFAILLTKSHNKHITSTSVELLAINILR